MDSIDNRNQVEGVQTSERVSVTDSGSARLEARTPVEPSSSIKVTLMIDYIFWVIVAFVLLRFAFKLIGANGQNAFVGLIYNVTNSIVGVFQGIVSDAISGPMVVEFSSLVAIAILWLIYKGILRLIAITK